ncbi:hypothetical protein CTI12_AA150840 [Artemisia annua]|uniref:Transposase-associated domain-containing protein n=1 Tax=Artemisia annua TaxID=35608 RepID=A0A2U1PHQ8_ARTAN|nr:hypothetical protein CTI12_AA150840 [Artemisia annua]
MKAHITTKTFKDGVKYFINFARTGAIKGEISCPCNKCGNDGWFLVDVVHHHILRNGFCSGYTLWTLHGELDTTPPISQPTSVLETSPVIDDIRGLVRDALGVNSLDSNSEESSESRLQGDVEGDIEGDIEGDSEGDSEEDNEEDSEEDIEEGNEEDIGDSEEDNEEDSEEDSEEDIEEGNEEDIGERPRAAPNSQQRKPGSDILKQLRGTTFRYGKYDKSSKKRTRDDIECSNDKSSAFGDKDDFIEENIDGKVEIVELDGTLFAQAHRYVLLNHPKIQPLRVRFYNEQQALRNEQLNLKTMEKLFVEKFSWWLKQQVPMLETQKFDQEVLSLAVGPNSYAKQYKGFITNGFRFLTKRREENLENEKEVVVELQNNGFVSTSTMSRLTSSVIKFKTAQWMEIIIIESYHSHHYSQRNLPVYCLVVTEVILGVRVFCIADKSLTLAGNSVR